MSGSDYFARLAGVLAAAALLGLAIARPEAGRLAVERASDLAPPRAALADRACPAGQPALTHPFAPLEDVLSVSPLGAATAPGEPLPAPHIRVNTRRGETVFERRSVDVLAPARADIVAIERRIERDETGRAAATSWTLRLKPCASVSVYYDRLDSVAESLIRRAGGLSAFVELGGPDHIAVETRIRVREGEFLGRADGFDVGLYDLAVPPAPFARPERYRYDAFARAEVLDAPPSLLDAIRPDLARARCALDYLPRDLREAWTAKLGDAWGVRRAKGENACRTALIDAPGAAQGVWFTDASHNALTSRVSAIALAPDAIDPERLVFALHGRLRSLKPEMVALPPALEDRRAGATRDFLSFEKGAGLVNPPFDAVRENQIYCYQGLRANFVGPRINAVLLLQLSRAADGARLMKLEARGDALSCDALPAPWSFTGAETTFYR
ncbi:hypothetical protein [Amphiplicatus metriothermophilus]|uniref:Uncharacterized protein n=1 Tax=Amphiplicatus metriothermophilus TaxID=1519374 RepID=A0A239PK41_9PROT|nr:hypothetical protein [Amphiplicatus metriothermophilus]MBB5517484.1 hypothetical protein [Amphiplicatus metriothermophilus]SNT68181.1 hypothetical protein SAMN06297382_0678 [Amphiplicatus metriothermophilus]